MFVRFFFFFFFSAILQAGFFPKDFAVKKSSLLNEKKIFYKKKLVNYPQLHVLFEEFLDFQSNPFMQKRVRLSKLIDFNKKIISYEKGLDQIARVWLASMKSTYLVNEFSAANFRFIENLNLEFLEDEFLSFLTYKSLFDLCLYFPKSEWNKSYKQAYFDSLFKWIRLASPKDRRIVFNEVSFVIKNHLSFFDKDAFAKELEAMPKSWLKAALQGQLSLVRLGIISFVRRNPKAPRGKTLRDKIINHLSIIKKELLSYDKEDASYPETMTLVIEMINKYFLNERKSSYQYFQKAIKKEFDYLPLYQAYYTSLRNYEDRASFAVECYLTGRFDTFVPSILWFPNRGSMFDTTLVKLSKQVFVGYQKNENNFYGHDKQLLNSYLFNNFFLAKNFDYAYEIFKASKFDLVNFPKIFSKKIIEKLGYIEAIKQMDNYAIQGLYEDIDWSHQRGLPVKRSPEQVKYLLEEIEHFKTDKKLSTNANYVISILENILTIENKFHSGEWLDLDFDKNLSLWRVYAGKFEYKDKKTVVGTNNFIDKSQYLAHRAYFVPPYELELTVKPLKNYLRSQALPTGLIIGKMHSKVHGRALYINEMSNYAAIYNPYDEGNKSLATLPIDKKGEYKLRARIYKNGFQFWVNGKELKRTGKDDFSSLLVSLGVVPLGAGKVEYSNMRIRSLVKDK